MKKIFALLLIVVMTAALFTGCAGTTSTASFQSDGNSFFPAADNGTVQTPVVDSGTVQTPVVDSSTVQTPVVTAAPANNTGVAGTYVVTSYNGQTMREYYSSAAAEYGMDLETFLSLVGMSEYDLDSVFYMVLDEDGTAEMYAMGEPEDGIANYTFDGSNITFYGDSNTTVCPYANGSFTLNIPEQGTTMVFTKR